MALVLSFLIFCIPLIPNILSTDIESLLIDGIKALRNGQLNEALSIFNVAVDTDPQNYLALYRRGTAYLAMGKVKLALPDIDNAIKINPGYIPGIQQRASIFIKLRAFNSARADLHALKNVDPQAENRLNEIDLLEEKISLSKSLITEQDYSAALSLLDEIIEIINLDSELRELRATCYLKLGDLQRGVQDMRNSVHLVNDNREGILRISEFMYNNGLAIQSLEEIRHCLILDPDDAACRKHYNIVNKLAKLITKASEASESERWEDCSLLAAKIADIEANNDEYIYIAHQHICHCGGHAGSIDALKACDLVYEKNPQSTDALFDKAEAYIKLDRFDEAIKLFQSILEKEPNNKEAHNGINRVQKLKKMASKRDYYKILGVPRSASKSQILKSYRKLAAEWHPDKFTSKDEKELAQKKFIEITAAKEVLSDADNRAKFDSGTDPLDSDSHDGFEPFGSNGPFGFKFKGFNPFEGQHFEFHFG